MNCSLIIVVSLSMLLGIGCTPSKQESAQSTTLSVQIPGEPVSLDPGNVEDGIGLQIISNTSSGLLKYDHDGKLTPGLAEKFEISNQSLKYTFSLRKEAKWSDGKGVTIDDFLTAFRRLVGPGAKSKLSVLFFNIKGARSFHDQTSPTLTGVYEKDGKLVIELEKKLPFFSHMLTLPTAYPLRKDVLDQNGGAWPDVSPGTGPYSLKQHKMGQKVILEKNEFFWGNPAHIPRVEFQIITQESTALSLFEAGRLDILTRISTLDLQRLSKSHRVQTDPFLATYGVAFNCRKPPFNNKKWRQAVAGSIQRREVVDLLNSNEILASGWVPQGLEGALSSKTSESLFSSAMTWARNEKLQTPLQMGFDNSERNVRVFEKIQRDLMTRLSVKSELHSMDWKTSIRQFQTDPDSIFRFALLAPYFDPILHLKAFTTGNPNNYSGCSNLEYDRKVAEIEGMDFGPKREAKIREAQKILLEEETMIVPLFHYVQNTGLSKRVEGFHFLPVGITDYSLLSFH